MATPPHGRTWILLSAGMAAGLAAPPPDLTAQAGPGDPGRPLGAWMSEARKSPFQSSTGPGAREHPTVTPADGLGTANTRYAPWSPASAPDSAVSPDRVFLFTLAGATIPLIPAMILEDSVVGVYAIALGGLATLVTVPIAAVAAGIDSFPRTLAYTVAGFLAGLGSATLANSSIPVFPVTMATVITLMATM